MPVPGPAPRPQRRVGLGVLLTGGTGDPSGWSQAGDHFATLDRLGCSTIWLADHLFWAHPMPEALVMAAVAATSTRQCRVGTGVLQLPLRSAAAVAKASTTLQVVSGGRFVLGVGGGEHDEEYRRAGADFAHRGRSLDQAIDQLRGWWSEGAEAGRFRQRPSSAPIPVWVGGRSPAALGRAARRGDGWLPMFLPAERFAAANQELDHLLESGGRDAGAVVRAPVSIVAVTDSSWRRQDALEWAARLWSMDVERLDRHLITGTAAACATQLARYRSLGADEVAVLAATDRPIEMFAELNPAFLAETGAPPRSGRHRQGA
jgi:alkanesulfonate monooxygenase SsuD/methylene tetrahydromethanopterin reductase-like flavin-dependent oxidoreductase (luciferase family)